MDKFWTYVDPFCPHFTYVFATVPKSHLTDALTDGKFLPPDPFCLPWDDTGRHLRQGRSHLNRLYFSSEAAFYMPFQCILHFVYETR